MRKTAGAGAMERRPESGTRPAGESTWLESTRREAADLASGPEGGADRRRPWYRSAWFWSCVYLAVVAYIHLSVLW